MPSPDKINEYLIRICEQVRWREIRPRIETELRDHILDQRDAYMSKGIDEAAATERAIAETGDAAMLGSQFDRAHRPPQKGLLALTFVLLAIGLLTRMFIFNDEDYYGFFFIRFLGSVIGTGALLAAYRADYTLIGKYPKIFCCAVLTLFVIVPTPSDNSFYYVFYAQYVILLFPLALAAVIFAAGNGGYRGLLVSEGAFALMLFAAFAAPSVSGGLLFFVSSETLLCVAVGKRWFGVRRLTGFLITLGTAAVCAAILLAGVPASGWNRVVIAFNPEIDPNAAGYTAVMTKTLLSGAKWIGQGAVPNEYGFAYHQAGFFQTDLLLTHLIVSLGWVSFVILMAILLFFIIKGFALCLRQRSRLGLLVSLAVMSTFAAQVALYVVYNLGFQLFAPISLPLLSYGNTATIVNMGLIGVMLSVFRTAGAGGAAPIRRKTSS